MEFFSILINRARVRSISSNAATDRRESRGARCPRETRGAINLVWFASPTFADLTRRNRRRRAAVAAAERVGVRAEASRRQVPPAAGTSITWSLAPPRRRRPGCRPSRAASASYVATTICDPAGTPWRTYGECVFNFTRAAPNKAKCR